MQCKNHQDQVKGHLCRCVHFVHSTRDEPHPLLPTSEGAELSETVPKGFSEKVSARIFGVGHSLLQDDFDGGSVFVNRQIEWGAFVLVLDKENVPFGFYGPIQVLYNVPDDRGVPPQGRQVQRSLSVGVLRRKTQVLKVGQQSAYLDASLVGSPMQGGVPTGIDGHDVRTEFQKVGDHFNLSVLGSNQQRCATAVVPAFQIRPALD
mmetsp:Transcript_11534/g.29191  ORF Transcript_11534/g.29191 Transcript_11534/m.29191 type:complete len:206 (+) Transcript_11534:914-1531(+)